MCHSNPQLSLSSAVSARCALHRILEYRRCINDTYRPLALQIHSFNELRSSRGLAQVADEKLCWRNAGTRAIGQNVLLRMQAANRRLNVVNYTHERNRACFHPAYAPIQRSNVPSPSDFNLVSCQCCGVPRARLHATRCSVLYQMFRPE